MTEQMNPAELQSFRDRIAELEAARDQPQVVTVEGFEGLRQLSHAIETKNLDAFMLDRSRPDKLFWWGLIAFVAFMVGAFLIAFSL